MDEMKLTRFNANKSLQQQLFVYCTNVSLGKYFILNNFHFITLVLPQTRISNKKTLSFFKQN